MADLFDTSVSDEPSFFAFGIQQVAIPLCGFFAMALAPNPFDPPTPALASRIGAVLVYLVAAGIGGGIAAVATPRVRVVRESGRWVWVLPTLFILIALILDSVDFSIKTALSGLFLPSSDGEDWWAFLFLTAPTGACITYSVAIAFLPESLFAAHD